MTTALSKSAFSTSYSIHTFMRGRLSSAVTVIINASFSLISLTYKNPKSMPEYCDPILSTSMNLLVARIQCLLIACTKDRLPAPRSPNTSSCDSLISSLYTSSLSIDCQRLPVAPTIEVNRYINIIPSSRFVLEYSVPLVVVLRIILNK